MHCVAMHGDAEPHAQVVKHAEAPLQTYCPQLGVPVTMQLPVTHERSVSVPAAQLVAQPLPGPPFCGWQVPARPPTLHDEHVPHGPAVAQHTVSTQLPVAHSEPLTPQAVPFACLQLPEPSHAWPAPEQPLPGPSNCALHAPAMAGETLHDLQVPHDGPVAQHTVSTQLPVAHSAPLVPQPVPFACLQLPEPSHAWPAPEQPLPGPRS
jgi:hypothetical protein